MPEALPALALQGRRILVAEDDYILAEELKADLEGQGAEVLGPVPDLESARELLTTTPAPDAALLDINLGGEMVYPLADILQDRNIPFVFATGYEEWAIAEPYASLPRLEKPLDMRQVARALVE